MSVLNGYFGETKITITMSNNSHFIGLPTGKKKGDIKVHSVIHVNEGVPCDERFTSATYFDIRKGKLPKLISLPTNDFDMPMNFLKVGE